MLYNGEKKEPYNRFKMAEKKRMADKAKKHKETCIKNRKKRKKK